MPKGYFIKFEGFPINTDRIYFYNLFGKFAKILKLYIHPTLAIGSVYFESQQIVEEVFDALNKNPPYNLKFAVGSTIPSADTISNGNSDSSTNSGEKMYYQDVDMDDDLMAECGPVLVNIHGVEVNTLSTDDGEIYVPLSDVTQLGFELFDPLNPPIQLDYDTQLVKEFELYLAMKSRKYMVRNKIKIPELVVENMKHKFVKQVFKNTPRPVQLSSDNIKITLDQGSQNFSPREPRTSYITSVSDGNDVPSNSRQSRMESRPLNETNRNVHPQHQLRKPHVENQNRQTNKHTDSFQKVNYGTSSYNKNQGIKTSSNNNGNKHFDNSHRNNSYRKESEIIKNTEFVTSSPINTAVNCLKPVLKNNNPDIASNEFNTPRNREFNKPTGVKTIPTDNLGATHALKKNEPTYRQIGLQLNVPVEMAVTFVENKTRCWAFPKSNKDLVEEILYKINTDISETCIVEPHAGQICAATYLNNWYRAVVINTDPTLKVRYIDFGNGNTEKIDEVRVLSDNASSIPGQAVCMQFEDTPSLHLEEDLEIKIIASKVLPDGTYSVNEERRVMNSVLKSLDAKPAGVEYKQQTEKHTPIKTKVESNTKINNPEENFEDLKSSTVNTDNDKPVITSEIKKIDQNTPHKLTFKQRLDTVSKFDNAQTVKTLGPLRKLSCEFVGEGCIEFIEVIGENSFVAFVCTSDLQNDLLLVENMEKDCRPDVNFIAKIGETVAIYRPSEQSWARGTIINVKNNEYVVALIDYGLILSTDKICQLDKKYCDIPEFTCVCSTTSECVELINKCKEANITIIEPNKLKLQLNNTSGIVTCKKWDPFLTSSKSTASEDTPVIITTRPTEKEVNVNDVVIIVAASNGRLLLRTKECNKLFNDIKTEISKCKQQPLLTKPVIGQVVLCPYEAGKEVYRGVVVSVNNNYVDIEFIDYGYQDTIPLRDLIIINESLAKKDCTLLDIKLKGFEGKDFSDEVLDVLNHHSSNRDKFTVVSTVQQGVFDLIDLKKNSLSEKLSSLDQVRATSQASAASSCVTYEKIGPCGVKMGTNDLICINAENLKDGIVGFMEYSDEFLPLSLQITEYAIKDNTPYCPSVNEICLAEFEGEWYRAKTENTDKASDKYGVYYIDYGNYSTVSSKDIRKIPREFTKIPPIAINCNLIDVKNSGKPISNILLDRLQDLIVPAETYSINILNRENEIYNITIPKVIEVLKKENLI